MSERADNAVFVTGAAGFLGAWTIAGLLGAGLRPIGFDRSEDRSRLTALIRGAAASRVPWIVGDIADAAALEAAVREAAPVAIVHMAALTIPAVRADPVLGTRVNIGGHVAAFQAAVQCGVRRVIYLSSAAAKPRGPLGMPANLYGIHKRACEDIARYYDYEHGLPSVGLRPFVVYGVGRDTGETAAVTQAMKAAAEGRRYDMPFAGHCCFQYAGELSEIISRLAATPFEGAVVSDTATRVAHTDDVIRAIREAVPGADVRSSDHQRPGPDEPFDDTPLRDLIGDWPETSLTEGTRRTIDSFRALLTEGAG